MRFELMLPHQIRAAIAANTPVVLPIGVLEYHGEHLGVGMDTLAVTRALDLLEREADLVILPAFHYGAASHAVVGPEGTGSLHVDAGRLAPFAEDLFLGLLRIGFRNIHGIVHHQSENFRQGMPTDLAFRLGARQAIFRFLEATRGEGWWGDAAMAEYYADQAAGADPFGCVKLHRLLPDGNDYPFDHAGEGETSLMLALAPEAVEMARLAENRHWYTASAAAATRETGERGRDAILAHLRVALGV